MSRTALALLFLTAAIATGQVLADDGRPSVNLAGGLSVEDVLHILHEHSEDPTVIAKILFKSGAEAEGRIRNYSERGHTCQLVLKDGSVSLVASDEISAVTIVNAGSAKIALQGNKIYREPKDPVLTQLAFKRFLKQVREDKPVALLAELSEEQINNADCRFYSEKVLVALRSITGEIVSQQDGREAFARRGNSVYLVQSTKDMISVGYSDGRLHVDFDCVTPLIGNYAKVIHKELLEHL